MKKQILFLNLALMLSCACLLKAPGFDISAHHEDLMKKSNDLRQADVTAKEKLLKAKEEAKKAEDDLKQATSLAQIADKEGRLAAAQKIAKASEAFRLKNQEFETAKKEVQDVTSVKEETEKKLDLSNYFIKLKKSPILSFKQIEDFKRILEMYPKNEEEALILVTRFVDLSKSEDPRIKYNILTLMKEISVDVIKKIKALYPNFGKDTAEIFKNITPKDIIEILDNVSIQALFDLFKLYSLFENFPEKFIRQNFMLDTGAFQIILKRIYASAVKNSLEVKGNLEKAQLELNKAQLDLDKANGSKDINNITKAKRVFEEKTKIFTELKDKLKVAAEAELDALAKQNLNSYFLSLERRPELFTDKNFNTQIKILRDIFNKMGSKDFEAAMIISRGLIELSMNPKIQFAVLYLIKDLLPKQIERIKKVYKFFDKDLDEIFKNIPEKRLAEIVSQMPEALVDLQSLFENFPQKYVMENVLRLMNLKSRRDLFKNLLQEKNLRGWFLDKFFVDKNLIFLPELLREVSAIRESVLTSDIITRLKSVKMKQLNTELKKEIITRLKNLPPEYFLVLQKRNPDLFNEFLRIWYELEIDPLIRENPTNTMEFIKNLFDQEGGEKLFDILLNKRLEILSSDKSTSLFTNKSREFGEKLFVGLGLLQRDPISGKLIESQNALKIMEDPTVIQTLIKLPPSMLMTIYYDDALRPRFKNFSPNEIITWQLSLPDEKIGAILSDILDFSTKKWNLEGRSLEKGFIPSKDKSGYYFDTSDFSKKFDTRLKELYGKAEFKQDVQQIMNKSKEISKEVVDWLKLNEKFPSIKFAQ